MVIVSQVGAMLYWLRCWGASQDFGEERSDLLFSFAQIVGLPEATVEQLRQIAARGPQQT